MNPVVNKDNNADHNVDKLLFDSNNKDNEFDGVLDRLEKKNEVKKRKRKMKSKSKPKQTNTNKAEIPSSNELDLSEPPEFEFLKHIDDIQTHSKNEIDKTKQIDMSFLPSDLLYNETNIHKSSEEIIQSINLLENKITNKEQHKKKHNKKEKKGFFENFFSFLSCNECY